MHRHPADVAEPVLVQQSLLLIFNDVDYITRLAGRQRDDYSPGIIPITSCVPQGGSQRVS
jgi:hypothetical protein